MRFPGSPISAEKPEGGVKRDALAHTADPLDARAPGKRPSVAGEFVPFPSYAVAVALDAASRTGTDGAGMAR